MASSKVMASTSQPNPDLTRQSSPSALLSSSDQSRNFGSMTMEDILENMCSDSDSFALENNDGGGGGGGSSAVDGGDAGEEMRNGSESGNGNGNKTVDEVWREIVSGGGTGESAMTLEDFLTKAGAVSEEGVGFPVMTMAPPPPATTAFGMDTMMNSAVVGVGAAAQFPPVVSVQNGSTAGGFGMEIGNRAVAGRSGGNGRGKRRAALEEVALDKATQQRQKRMIKNRESAARSRERKQAYTVELESMVTQLEEENARLWKEEAEQNKKRYKQLMENLIPVVEQKRPPRVLRRMQSMTW